MITDGNIIYLVGCFRIFRGSGQYVHLRGIVDVAKISTGFAVAVDIHRFVFDERGYPFGDYNSTGTIGILATTENIEIAQADSFEIIGAGKDIGVDFIHPPGNSIGGKWFANLVFPLGRSG